MLTESAARRLLEDDPRATAEAAGLRYVDADGPGFTRLRWGRGFTYRHPDTETVRDRALRARFEALVIPPAWTGVWICPDPDGHLQATGRDDAGRKQYLYHPRWREVRDAEKFRRVIGFGRLLPRIRRVVDADLAQEGLTRRRVLASVARLLETTLVRVGYDEYARANDSYGLATLRKRHVERAPGEDAVRLEFTGKADREWEVRVEDPEVVEVIVDCLEVPGYALFKYFDAEGQRQDVSADDVNAYLRAAADAPVSARDFRTWTGTVLAAMALEELEELEPDAARAARLRAAVKTVAEELGNTPAVCRACYIHPEVLALGEADVARVAEAVGPRARARLAGDLQGLRPSEAAVLAYLESRLRPHEDAAA